MSERLTESELSRIRDHVRCHVMTLALVKTERAPGNLAPVLKSLEDRLGLRLARTYSSPMSEFSMAEFGSEGRALVVLFMAGNGTELIGLSETDEVSVRDLEDGIHYSNFHSEILRHGL